MGTKMVAHSKFTLLEYSCYELGHTWHPSCKQASIDVFLCVMKQALKVYGSLYLIAGILRKRGKDYYKKKVWQEILQSTVFLTTNGTLFITCFCIWRKLAGFYFYPNAFVCGMPASAVSLAIERKERRIGIMCYTNLIGFLPCLVASFVAILLERKSRKMKLRSNMSALAFEPAFTASFLAILLERKSRRGLLAVYMGNIAVETLWRMLVARGYVKSIPNGEVLLFSVASAIYLYYFKKPNGLPQGTLSIFKKMFGSSEICQAESEENQNSLKSDHDRTMEHNFEDGHRYRRAPPHVKLVQWLKNCPSHRLCRHKHSCSYYVLEGTLRMFGIGYAVQAGIKLLGALRKVVKQPKSVIQALLNKTNLQLGAFLGCFVGIYRAVNCLLRWLREKDESLHGLLAGFLAGWSMMFYKSPTVALYTAAKVAELLYFKGIAMGKLPYIRCADIIIYSLSTALVFHAAVIEPHNLRPAYWNFLLKVTDNRFAMMNRRLLDPHIPNCSKIAPDYWPDYDMRYTNLVKPS